MRVFLFFSVSNSVSDTFSSPSCFHFLVFTAWTDSCVRMRRGEVSFFFLHFIAPLSSLHSTHVTVASVRAPHASPNEHITVAAGLNLKGETCWMFWRLLLLRARLSSPPAATRGWYHYRVQPEHNSIDLMRCFFFSIACMHACPRSSLLQIT